MIEELVNEEAQKIAKIYKRFKRPYRTWWNKKNIGKYNKDFIDTVKKFMNMDNWHPFLFIEAQFQNGNQPWPAQLKTDYAWRNYETFLEEEERNKQAFDKNDFIKILKEINNTIKIIKRKGNDYTYYINSKNGMSPIIFDLKNGFLSPYFLCIWKPFLEIYDKTNNIETIFSKKELKKCRTFLKRNKKIIEKIKEKFSNEKLYLKE